MIIPERLYVGLPMTGADVPPADHIEAGADWGDPPDPKAFRSSIGKAPSLTFIASPVITHRSTDPRYKSMKSPPPEHAAVGHFERSRWTDEAWERTDALARAIDAMAVVLQTPSTFKATAEHALRLENFVAHAMRPGLAIGWEWADGSWPVAKAMALCERIGAIPVVDPTKHGVPDGEFVYLRFRGGASGRAVLKDDDLKKVALAARDRIGWVIFSNRNGATDADRFQQMV